MPLENILFLPDLTMQYNGCQIDNIRLNISSNRLVDDLIDISKAIFRFTNKGSLAYQHAITFEGKDAEIIQNLDLIKSSLIKMINNGDSKNSRCFCGRKSKYKYCHGRDLQYTIEHL